MNDEWWFKERIDDKTILTIFGTAKIQKDGYYVITTRKEGNNKAKLHRLIWEDKFGSIPDGYVIHHLNKNNTKKRVGNPPPVFQTIQRKPLIYLLFCKTILLFLSHFHFNIY